MFETQLTSNNLKRRNEKLDLHGPEWLRGNTVAGKCCYGSIPCAAVNASCA